MQRFLLFLAALAVIALGVFLMASAMRSAKAADEPTPSAAPGRAEPPRSAPPSAAAPPAAASVAPAGAPSTRTDAAQLAADARAAARRLPTTKPGATAGFAPQVDYFADPAVLAREAQLDDATARRVCADHAPYVEQLRAVDRSLPPDEQWHRGSALRDAFEEGLTAYLTQDQLAHVIWLMDQKNRIVRVRPDDPATDPAARAASPANAPGTAPKADF